MTPPIKARFIASAALAAALALCAGCLGPAAKKLADRETYPIIAQKQAEALGAARDFTIEDESNELTERVLGSAGKASDEFTTEGLRISLADDLALAVHNSRTYQTQKENLYLSALALTQERHNFSPIFSGAVSGEYRRTPVLDANGHVIDATRTGTLDGGLSATKLIAATGGRITVGLAASFLRFYSADPNEQATGALSAAIVQPLLRGAGMRVASENLRQAERDVIYQARDFARFERDFIVDRIDEYFRLLQSLDQVGNERKSYLNLQAGRERNEWLAKAGKLAIFQVDQSRQQELSQRNRWITAQSRFAVQLDQLKINLGLPTDLKIFPDERELQDLIDAGLQPVDRTPDQAVQEALERRLDRLTAKERVEDAARRLNVRENALLPQLDATARFNLPDDNQNQPLSFDIDRRDWSVGADLDLPLDRKSERNAYRAEVIAGERAARAFEQSTDGIVQEVRAAFQALHEAEASYEIQRMSLEVAERRLESTNMLLEAGRAIVRDVLDADQSLLTARNARTRALIDYSIARLRFLVAIEALEVDDEGAWREGAIQAAAPPPAPAAAGGN